MVTRKPLPQSFDGADSDVPDVLRPGGRIPSPANPQPNPSPTPSGASASPAAHPYSGFEAEEESIWTQPAPIVPQTTAAQYSQQQEPPQQEKQQQQQQQLPLSPVPSVLRPGAGRGTGGASQVETNPFKKKLLGAENSPSLSSTTLVPPSGPPPRPPTASFSQLDINEPSTNPWQPALTGSSRNSPAPPVVITDASGSDAAAIGEDVWGTSQNPSELPTELPSRKPSPGAAQNAPKSEANLIHFPEDEGDNAGWDEIASPVTTSAPAAGVPPSQALFNPLSGKEGAAEDEAVFEDQHAWDDLGGGGLGKAASQGQPPSQSHRLPSDLTTETAGEGWSLVDDQGVAPGQLSRQSTWENFTDDEEEGDSKSTVKEGKAKGKAKGKNVDAAEPASSSAPELLIPIEPLPGSQENVATNSLLQGKKAEDKEGPRPQLPPRSMLDVGDDVQPPAQPPRPAAADKTETYQIKNITWYDIHAAENPRVSPILLQNANGPCPLVALVNALTLTTPADTPTALVDTLRSREQVSLSLLLDAVFDELMSSRRSNNGRELPDVGELYKFLKGLHTGMNVNPRFIPTPEVVKAFRRTSLTHLHPTERDEMVPGTFEETREMQLYATFNIPLIHGWLPATSEPVYEALRRQAASYEDVQNLLFREEELEEKLSSPTGDGLTEAEQELYQDILEIKTFLHVSATQLTPFGLDVLAKAMKPGTFAILFRNDHFSTLYRHPETMQLLSLVTDAGYASHDEVIWETLVDVNGEHAEFYSGDFRLVGGGPQHREEQYEGAMASSSNGGPSSGGQDGWTTVRSRRKNRELDGVQESGDDLERHEQEDRDLALALQLQEEEEERHRAEEARRNRESRLSEQFIEQQARQSTPNFHNGARRPSNATGGGRYSSTQQVPVSPRRSSAGYYGIDGHRRTSSSSATGSGLLTTASNGQGGRHRGRTSSTSSFPQQQQAPPQPPRPQQQQVVRPLVPPAASSSRLNLNPAPAVHRPADPEDGEEAPPSYEQAAKQAPYHPPPGAPGSERPAASGSSSNLGQDALPRPQPQPMRSSASGRPYVTPGVYSQQPMRPQQPIAANRGDRDCVIM